MKFANIGMATCLLAAGDITIEYEVKQADINGKMK